jgi:hypothetical protein
VRLSALDEWLAENLRATFFVETGEDGPKSLYLEVVGDRPSETVERPTMQFRQERGQPQGFEKPAQILVLQGPGRVDVVLSAVATGTIQVASEASTTPFFWIDHLEKSVAYFDTLTERLSLQFHTVSRVAYALTALKVCESAAEAVEFLATHLPALSLDPQRDRDVSLQVNRTRPDGDGNYLNRLSRWEMLETKSVLFDPLTMAIPLPGAVSARAVRTYIDVSTNQERAAPILGDDVRVTLVRLRNMAMEIAEAGDIA